VSDSFILQQPATAKQLMVLHHGVGGSAQSMVPVGQQLAAQFPDAFIVCVYAPNAFDTGAPRQGRAVGGQWFSVQGITEENRAARVAEAMPAFLQDLAHWQQTSGVAAAATALVGFSQGAIMSLEAAKAQNPIAGRIVALSGRYATLPDHAPDKTTLHFVHGKSDPVIHYGHCVTAAERLVRLGADVTADVIPYLAHEINDEVMQIVLDRLTGHIPQHQWDEVPPAATLPPEA